MLECRTLITALTDSRNVGFVFRAVIVVLLKFFYLELVLVPSAISYQQKRGIVRTARIYPPRWRSRHLRKTVVLCYIACQIRKYSPKTRDRSMTTSHPALRNHRANRTFLFAHNTRSPRICAAYRAPFPMTPRYAAYRAILSLPRCYV